MTQNKINHQRLSVAATFYEPVYQRLRPWNDEGSEQILGFSAPTDSRTRSILESAGATMRRSSRYKCFSEVWSLPDPMKERTSEELIEFDRRISDSVRCHGGRFSAACGTIRWDDAFDEPHRRRHILSQLLQESQLPRGRGR